ncbi:hypothetical protein THRCLA_04377 [Thraustotheca clavata]|uniref:WD repeat-containing protein 75 second beta-propeller domain-containing protein n=1 Tax=Thraustotheca clavata TaxID=74557 RepID=A0A1V9ZZ83_9STRA|nr:hypothetical protein THRCLA_04377 [Thraustotheca clavata]
MAQKLSSGCTRAQRCHGIKASVDGKLLFEAHGDAVVVRGTKTGQIQQYLRILDAPTDPNKNALGEKMRLEMRNAQLRAHFNALYKNPHPEITDEKLLAAHKTNWVKRQVAKYAIPADHLSHVTSFALHPTQSNHLLVATADHLIRVWDIEQGTVVDTFTVRAPVVWMEASTVDPSLVVLVLNVTPKLERETAFYLSKNEESKKSDAKIRKWTVNTHGLETTHWDMVAFNLSKGVVEELITETRHRPFVGAAMQQRSSASSPYVNTVIAAGGNEVFYCRIGVKNTGDAAPRTLRSNLIKHVRPLSCVAIHPTSDEAVTGDCFGQMQVWRNLDTDNDPVPSKLHWHAHTVGCVAYSADGTYVASGGEEFVLVLWHLESGRRHHVPRLSAYLTGILTRSDGSGYYVACRDNSILYYNHITSTRVWQVGCLARYGLSSAKTLINQHMAVEPWSQTLALQGTSLIGNIQFYHPLQDRVLTTVALTERNQVSRTFDESPTRTYATQIAFSAPSRTMATVTTTNGESTLRFWTRKSDGSFEVNTDVDSPHGTNTITAVSAHDKLIVTGDDHGEFRVWAQVDGVWNCRSMSQFREVPIGALAFSDDGSLLAVAYGPLLTLWDPQTNALRSVLSYPKDAISDLIFSGATTPYIVARTPSGIYVWSLLTCTIHWFYHIPVSCMSVDKDAKGQLVVGLTTNRKGNKDIVGHVIVFSLDSPIPTAIYRLPNIDIQDALFYKQHLLVMDTISQVHAVGDAMLVSSLPVTIEAESNSILKQMYGSWTTTDVASSKEDGKTTSSSNGMFEAPAHVLPPLRSLYRSFLDTMLAKAKEGKVEQNKHQKHAREEDIVISPSKKVKVDEETPEDTYAALKKVFSKK